MLSNIKGWGCIKYDQYMELLEMQDDEDLDDITGITIIQLCILCDLDEDDDIFYDMTVDDIYRYRKQLNFLRSTPNNNFKRKIGDMVIKDLNELDLGEFIDLEHFFEKGFMLNLGKICSILYRYNKLDDWGNIIIEPYDYNLNEREKKFNELNITDIFGVIKYYQDWKEDFMSKYGALFEGDDLYEIEDKEELDAEELRDAEEEIEENKKKSQFAWESLLLKLCNNDITKFDKAFKTRLLLCMNTLNTMKINGEA